MDTGFGARWGWLISAGNVAEMERIPLAKVYDLSTINFLNDLAYLKDKANHEKEEQRRWLQKHRINSCS